MSTIIVGIIVAALFVLSAFSVFLKREKNACCGGCEGCGQKNKCL